MSASEDIALLRAALEDEFCNCTGNAIVSEKRQDHALAALARLEQRVDAGLGERVSALEDRLVNVPAKCPHGCRGHLQWVDDSYFCPKCRDEWAFETIWELPV